MRNVCVSSRRSLPPPPLLSRYPQVFRREPLWKISMNIRVKPTVRCTFDAEEGVVRFVLKESVGSQEAGSEAQSGAKESTQEVVVYALKARIVRLNPRASPSRIFFSLEGHARSRTSRSLQSRFCRARTSNLPKLLCRHNH